MIEHIVLFTLAATDPADRRRDAAELKERLEHLVHTVPGVLDLRVGPDLGEVEGHWDLVLVSHHASRAALAEYASHPVHREVIDWVSTKVSSRAVVDVEWDG